MDDLPPLTTERLVLRFWRESDRDILLRILSQKETVRYLPQKDWSPADVAALVRRAMAATGRGQAGDFTGLYTMITSRKDGRAMGWCGLAPLPPCPGEIEVFYGLAPEHWGRGLAGEAAAEIVQYGFTRAGLPGISAVYFPENIASGRILARLGFRFERVLTGLPPAWAGYEGEHLLALDRWEYFPSGLPREGNQA